MIFRFTLLLLSFSIIISCVRQDPNKDSHGEEVIEKQHSTIKPESLEYKDTTYVPIYSDIYSRSKSQTLLLSATLSIRNTSLTDTLYIDHVHYYNTIGDIVRKYIDKPIYLRPMETVDYVVDEKDTSGGTGANFIIAWGANNSKINPVIQAIMIGSSGQQGIAFRTDGVSISRK